MTDDESTDAPLKRKPGRPRKVPLPPAQTTTVKAPAFTVAAPVAVTEIAAETDRFRCGPYSCVLMASACIRRQDMLTKPRNERTGDYADCEKCEDGKTVRRRLQMAPKEPVPDMPKPGPMLLPKSAPWQRAEPSLPPNLAEIPDLPPPAELPPPLVTRRHPAAVVFDEAPDVTPEMVDGITPVLVSDVGVTLASTPQVPAVLTDFTAKLAPDGPPVRVRRVGTTGWSGKGQPRAESVAVTEAQIRLTHIAEVYEDLEGRTMGLLEAIRSTRAKLETER